MEADGSADLNEVTDNVTDDVARERAERSRNWSEPVWAAAIAGDVQSLVVLAARGHLVDVPHPTSGITPTWAAAEHGHLAVVAFLVSAMGADPDSRAFDGATPLFIAAQNGHTNVVAALLSSGADPDAVRRTDGATSLYVACQHAHLPVVRCLLLAGADPNLKRAGGFTPLWTACDRGYSSIVEMLVATSLSTVVVNGARPAPCADFGLPCDDGIRPAHAAKRAGHKHLARLVDLTAKHQVEAKRQGQLGAMPTFKPRNKRVDVEQPPAVPASEGAGELPPAPSHVRWEKELPSAKVGGPAECPAEGHAVDDSEQLSSPGSEPVGAQGEAATLAEASCDRAFADPSVVVAQPVSAGLELDVEAPGKRMRMGVEDSIFVYSTERTWLWERYIRQSAMYTHNLAKCVRRPEDAVAGALPPCKWWRLQPNVAEFESCQVSTALFRQVQLLHDVVGAGRLPKGLRLTQCLFTEGRGSEEVRRHSLELRLTHARHKRSKESGDAGQTSNPCLVRRDEVVLLLGLPLRFPLDGRVCIHCMQGRERLPANLFGHMPPGPVSPGDLLSLSWLTPEVWPSRYSLADFVKDLMDRVAANDSGDGLGGLLAVPPFKLNVAAANAALVANMAAAARSEAARMAKHNAPLKPHERRARQYAALAFATNILLLGVLLFLKKYSI